MRTWAILKAAGILLGVLASSAASAKAPKITLEWTGAYEKSACPSGPHDPAYSAAFTEAERRMPQFRQAWSAEGPDLLKVAEKLVGQPSPFGEAQIVLHVCREQPAGMVYPLMLNLGWFLESYEGRYRAEPDQASLFAERILHQVLHRYIREIAVEAAEDVPPDTPLLRAYAAEPFDTLQHVHLIALEELTYRKLGKARFYAALRERQSFAPAYRRAYEIVETVGAQAVVRDLRTAVVAKRKKRMGEGS